ncbi:MAG: hypothetical protein JWN76_2860 [Chitinophagaceae bacterium]|nr:hypothetical protein [Chitinophagaceae bacterium]
MKLKSFFFLVSLFGFLLANSQLKDIAKEFADSNQQNKTRGFYIASLRSLPPHLKIIRWLNDTTAIIFLDQKNLFIAKDLHLIKANNEWKWSEPINGNTPITKWNVGVINKNEFFTKAGKEHWLFKEVAENLFLVELPSPVVSNELLNDENIIYLQPVRLPKEEMVLNGFDKSANSITLAHSIFPAVDGRNVTVSIKENLPDTADVDFKKRFLHSSFEPTLLVSHATIMSTMMAGAGNSFYTGKGVAYGANLISTSFSSLIPEPKDWYVQNKIAVQNHSYGTGIENYYGVEAQAYDQRVNELPNMLPVFSSGNSGDQFSSGNYAGIKGLSNLTGSFKMAKNNIVVGATDSFNVVAALSSKGPAYDGRIKPELVAFGEDGSSGAAALVSGTALLLQQVYFEKNNQYADAALIKAILINSADDAARPNVDFESGFGSLNTYRAVKNMKDGNYQKGNTSTGKSVSFPITIPAGIKNLKITLSWADPAAQLNTYKALVNDLDLSVTNMSTNEKWLPWILNSTPNKDSLILNAKRGRDTLNNVEQVTIDNVQPGNYSIQIFGNTIPAGSQDFYITWQWDKADSFYWSYPTKMDNLFPAQQNVLRFNSSFQTTNGKAEISYDKGQTWNVINSNTNLSDRYIKANIKDTNALGLLRMTINTNVFYSDTFTISSQTNISVIYNCGDSAMISWNRISGVNNYQLYQLGDTYLEPFSIAADTSIVFHQTNSTYIAVAPIIQNKAWLRSYGLDYTKQGVGCLVNNLIAEIKNNNQALITAFLSVVPAIKELSFQKLTANGVIDLAVFNSINTSVLSATDNLLLQGINTYRVKILLNNGQVIYSAITQLYFSNNKAFILFPNPVNRDDLHVNILSEDFDNCVFELFDVFGRMVQQVKLKQELQQIRLPSLSTGVYTYIIRRKEERLQKGKLIIQ